MSVAAQEEPDERPDIIVLYLDDVDPHDARLWRHEERTPTLARLFDQAGVRFTSAVTETPLCSPGRAALLTGRHTANHGVIENVAAPFDPRVTIATEMRGAGRSRAASTGASAGARKTRRATAAVAGTPWASR